MYSVCQPARPDPSGRGAWDRELPPIPCAPGKFGVFLGWLGLLRSALGACFLALPRSGGIGFGGYREAPFYI